MLMERPGEAAELDLEDHGAGAAAVEAQDPRKMEGFCVHAEILTG